MTGNKITLWILISINTIAGCSGCLDKFYKVHNEVNYLDITFVDSTVHPSNVLHYIDSIVSKDTSHYEVLGSISNVQLKEQDRIIHFKKFPEEFYLISCNANPCWIKGVFNKEISSAGWIYERKYVNKREIVRIEERFGNEILNKVKTDSPFSNKLYH